jgi:formate-dependent nitrite reductase membrane component NrfD
MSENRYCYWLKGLLAAYSVFELLSFLNVLAVSGRLEYAPFVKLFNRIPRRIYGVVGMLTSLFVAGYPGVLLNATAWPLWESTASLLGALFIASGVSTGAAAIVLIMVRHKRQSDDSFVRLEKSDRTSMVLELLLIGLAIVIAGKQAAPILGGFYGVMLLAIKLAHVRVQY